MHIPTLIQRKRDGGALTAEEISKIIQLYTRGELPDYQMSALAMAIFFRGMTPEETAALTAAMRDSGTTLRWPAGAPPRVDKHSTGGIGDKTSLIIAPLLACDGLWVPMISGRGLGITGGTLDKLESIPGFNTRLSEEEILELTARLGCVMVGQTDALCPADKKLYALRDVTATVPTIPLLTSSILCKKLAEGLNRLVLDVKHGSGAFMRTREGAEALAESLVKTGAALGVHARVRINDMNEPTGHAVGNALEVVEAVECLQGRGPADLEDLVLDLCAEVANSSREDLRAKLHRGEAWAKFQEMTAAQGGDVDALEKLAQVHAAPVICELRADRAGMLRQVDAGTLGQAVLELGAGRSRASDPVDFAVGCDQLAKVGRQIQTGDTLLRIHARSQAAAEQALALIRTGIVIE